MSQEAQEFDPSKTTVSKAVNHAARKRILVWCGSVATIGAALVAINTFTGLNFRPAWGYEIEKVAAADVEIRKQLESVLEIQGTTARALGELKKGQLELRLKQIDREKRELRRELAGHQTRAQAFRDRSEPVPQWLLSTIADSESAIGELDEERDLVERQILELTQ